jgi:hypothetical protein
MGLPACPRPTRTHSSKGCELLGVHRDPRATCESASTAVSTPLHAPRSGGTATGDDRRLVPRVAPISECPKWPASGQGIFTALL